MQTITIDILNKNAINLLNDLENLKLIKLHYTAENKINGDNWTLKYKGKMTKQPVDQIEKQLHELRNEWE